MCLCVSVLRFLSSGACSGVSRRLCHPQVLLVVPFGFMALLSVLHQLASALEPVVASAPEEWEADEDVCEEEASRSTCSRFSETHLGRSLCVLLNGDTLLDGHTFQTAQIRAQSWRRGNTVRTTGSTSWVRNL